MSDTVTLWTSQIAEDRIRSAGALVNYRGVTLEKFERLAAARAAQCPCKECHGIKENAVVMFMAALTSTVEPVMYFEHQAKIAVEVLAGIDTNDEGADDYDAF